MGVAAKLRFIGERRNIERRESQSFIEGRKLLPQVDDFDVESVASGFSAVILHCVHEEQRQALSLERWVD